MFSVLNKLSKKIDLVWIANISQIYLSPQCGLSSNAIGNIISEQEQFDKPGMVVDLDTEIWGGSDQ